MAEVANISRSRGRNIRVPLLVVGILLVALILFKPVFAPSLKGDHYAYLAAHFASGDLAVDDLPDSYQDFVIWQGRKYLPLGPLPAVALIPALPFIGLGQDKIMAWVGHLLTLLNGLLLYNVLGRAGVDGERRWWALLLFFGGTVYLSAAVIGTSWFFAHILTTTLLLWAVLETLGPRRAWILGLALGLAAMTRLTALFALPFFLWMFWSSSQSKSQSPKSGVQDNKLKIQNSKFKVETALLLLGMAGPLALLFAYNYARFGSGLESGYRYAVLTYPPLAEALKEGLFSLAHIPKNLFMLFMQGPLPNPSANDALLTFPYVKPSPWGMGIFFTSPALLYAFRANLKSNLVRACLLAILSIMLPLMTYYGIGWIQFGYRYALDFIPFLLLIAALSLPNPMTRAARALVIASVVVNIWGTLFLVTWV